MTDDSGENRLAENLRRALRESGLSARSLSLAATGSDEVARNIIRGLSKHPRHGAVSAMARVLGTTEAALLGDEPWRDLTPALKRAKPETSGQPQRRARVHSGLRQIREYDLRTHGGAPINDGRSPLATWSVPTDLLRARALAEADLVLVRAPSALPPVAVGDRLLVDIGSDACLPSPPGTMLVYDGYGHTLAAVRLAPGGKAANRLRLSSSAGVDQVALDAVQIVGRVVGRWAWD